MKDKDEERHIIAAIEMLGDEYRKKAEPYLRRLEAIRCADNPPSIFVGIETITDDFGNAWSATCACGGKMSVVRPGKAQCSKCG